MQPEFEGGLEIVRAGLLRYGRDERDISRIIAKLRRDIYDEDATLDGLPGKSLKDRAAHESADNQTPAKPRNFREE